MKNSPAYIYKSIHIVARYLHSLSPAISPCKLQKSLYFLYAYYGALNAKQHQSGVESSDTLLFNSTFVAWTYGSVNREVYIQSKEMDYFNDLAVLKAIEEVGKNQVVKQFIEEMFEQINAVSDYTLISRNKKDMAWKISYEKDHAVEISNERLIKEYQERYL